MGGQPGRALFDLAAVDDVESRRTNLARAVEEAQARVAGLAVQSQTIERVLVDNLQRIPAVQVKLRRVAGKERHGWKNHQGNILLGLQLVQRPSARVENVHIALNP